MDTETVSAAKTLGVLTLILSALFWAAEFLRAGQAELESTLYLFLGTLLLCVAIVNLHTFRLWRRITQLERQVQDLQAGADRQSETA